MIIDPIFSIPIEIKSPGEEEFISVKGVRQALENKIVLLAREAYTTMPETTSLVVGYKLPNNRSEVNTLVSDIKKAYNINIGIIDLESLLYLVGISFFENKEHSQSDLQLLHGFIDVSDV
jgi:hypothetical protein